jgi:hypothetical protein
MPTKREREYYAMGFNDGTKYARGGGMSGLVEDVGFWEGKKVKRKRKLSDWQKFIKKNSNKRAFKYRDGKLNLKKMGVAYRKTAAYKRNKKK